MVRAEALSPPPHPYPCMMKSLAVVHFRDGACLLGVPAVIVTALLLCPDYTYPDPFCISADAPLLFPQRPPMI